MGFISKLVGASSDFEATPANIATNDYASVIKKLLASGVLNPVNFDESNQTGAQQNQLVQSLLQGVNGQTPSVAQAQLNNTVNQNVAQGAGMIASQKGLNPALAARLILNNTANVNQQAAGQGALLRAAEINSAQNALGNVLGAKRAQDISQSLGTVQSGASQLGTVGGLAGQQNAVQVQNQLGVQQLNQQTQAQNAQTAGNIFGKLLGAGSAILTGGATGGAMGGSSAAATGGQAGAAGFMAGGGVVPGKALVGKDSPANDTVPAMLSPGEIVIPRTAAKDPKKAKAFIDALMKNKGTSEEPTFGHVIAAQRSLHNRLKEIEKMCYGGMA